MSQWVQMDLLDLIAEAEAKQPTKKHQLHPALENWQSEYDRLIDQGAHELGEDWKQAEKNEAGVYVENVHEFREVIKKDVTLELNLAKVGDSIVGEVGEISSEKDHNYGSYSPLDDFSCIKVFTFSSSWLADCTITEAMNSRILDDNNLSDRAQEKLLSLVPKIVKRSIEEMK